MQVVIRQIRCDATVDWSPGEYERTAVALEPAAQVAVEALRLRQGEQVLDVACGTGNAALAAARAGAKVVAVDLAPRLVEVARARLDAEGFGDGRGIVLQGDATALPVGEAAFDAAVSVFGVIFARPAQSAVDELVRAVRPGGRIVVTSWVAEGPIHEYGRMVREAIESVAPPDSSPPTPPPLAWGDPAVLRELFAACAVVEVVEHELPFRGASPEAWVEEQTRYHPVWLAARAAVPADRWDDLQAQALAHFRAANEDPAAFRTTSRYLLARVRR
ncbi:class I SAM-dependent methyltransferase [Conexibacter sp. SYSU D00693]|uniref:class I SAM-dependent methyltransferase n=1 Tax=Conexibacter sp. SYSU D00693 TaxID=2812560 RepID=UPI001F11CEB4|nr:methyltransferase domain-containing protein [Conexibacter sp. SYSU D00693]